MKTILFILLLLFSVYANDTDTNTVEVLVIYTEFEFGFPKADTVASTFHLFTGKWWHVHTKYNDFVSHVKPRILARYPTDVWEAINKK